MKLPGSNIKKFLIYSYISGNGNPEKIPYISETETLKSFLYFAKWNFSAQAGEIKK